MPESSLHPRESLRLSVLQRLELLDSEAESAFDDLAELASNLCDTPIALVSLVANDRQWFKACVGLDVTETPRSQSFCSHAILDPKSPLLVEDASKDDRFSDNPLVTGAPDIRFYAGFPLVSLSEKMPVGTLCVIDRVPRKIDQQQLASLRILANQVEALIHLRESTIDLAEKNAAMETTQRELAAANDKLQAQAKELRLSNEELEQFAYVASHDLQEPLRKVSSFCALLRDEYGEQLNGDGAVYLNFAVDGALRMQTLIRDLLTFSRVKTQGETAKKTSASEVLQLAIQNLETAIEESAAEVSYGELPYVRADPCQLTQLFQNLIGNAIKYRGDFHPKIHVGFDAADDHWIFYVRDNGVGIAPEHQEQVFGILKRLQGRDVPGTGIGLAICRRIVERLGGRIWVESEVGAGSTFFFTLSKATEEIGVTDVEFATQAN